MLKKIFATLIIVTLMFAFNSNNLVIADEKEQQVVINTKGKSSLLMEFSMKK